MLIAVLGVTGAGKSTFINRASGSNLKVGRGLMSCESAVQISTNRVLLTLFQARSPSSIEMSASTKSGFD